MRGFSGQQEGLSLQTPLLHVGMCLPSSVPQCKQVGDKEEDSVTDGGPDLGLKLRARTSAWVPHTQPWWCGLPHRQDGQKLGLRSGFRDRARGLYAQIYINLK